MTNSECPYAPWQTDLIQVALKKVHAEANPKRGMLSWDDIANIIDRHFLNLANDEKQLIPIPYREFKYQVMDDGKKERPGNKLIALSSGRYSTIEPLHLIATAHWLMSGEVAGSSLTFENFYGAQHANKAAMALASFLNEVDDDASAISFDKLKGVYEKSVDTGGEVETQYVTICSYISHRIFSIRIEREEHITYMSKEYFDAQEDNKTSDEDKYEKTTCIDMTHYGWVVIAPYEQLYILMYDNLEKSAQILMPIAIDADVFSQNVQGFELLSQHEVLRVSDEQDADFARDDTKALMAEWGKKNARFIQKYHRVTD